MASYTMNNLHLGGNLVVDGDNLRFGEFESDYMSTGNKYYDVKFKNMNLPQEGTHCAQCVPSSDGTIVAVSHPKFTSSTGKVLVYEYVDETWSQKGSTLNGTNTGDLFGKSLSISDDGLILIVGASGVDTNTGNIIVYEWVTNDWVQKGSTIAGVSTSDYFGLTTAASADGLIFASGCYSNDYVKVYEWVTSDWVQKGSTISTIAYFSNSNPGNTIGLSSDGLTLVYGSNTNSGAIKIYYWNTGSSDWVKRGTTLTDGSQAGFAVSISSDGSIISFSSYLESATYGTGKVYVYSWSGSSWVLLGSALEQPFGVAYKFGHNVHLSGDGKLLAVSDPDHNNTGASLNGIVVLYHYESSSWKRVGKYISSYLNGEIGKSVRISRDGTKICCAETTDGGFVSELVEGVYSLFPLVRDSYVEVGSSYFDETENTMKVWNGSTWTGTLTDSSALTTSSSITTTGGGTMTIDGDATFNSDINVNSGVLFVDSSSGFVGINEETPTKALDVNGDVECQNLTVSTGGTITDGTASMTAGAISGVTTLTGSGAITGGTITDGTASMTAGAISGVTSLTGSGDITTTGDVQCQDLTVDGDVNLEYNYWRQLGDDIDGEVAFDASGQSIAMSNDGTIVAIGSHLNDGTANESGSVRVFSWSGTAWSQLGSDIDGEAEDDNSGYSVSLSGDGTIVAIGATGNNSATGHVRVYSWNGSVWSQTGSDIDGEASGDASGWSVSLSDDGTVIAIGSPHNDAGGSNAGSVRVYSWSGSVWSQIGSDIDGDAAGDYSGYSVSITNSGNRVVIGSPKDNSNTGKVKVYYNNSSVWTQLGSDITGEASSDEFGHSVSISGDGTTIAVGSPYNDGGGSNAGSVRVYLWSGSVWNQLGSDIDGEAADDNSGYSVSLSNDGTMVAIGAKGNDATGSNAGHARVYSYVDSTWTQIGYDIDGEAAGDNCGWAVSLSNDGSKVAVSARSNDGASGTSSGHVRVHTLGGTLDNYITEATKYYVTESYLQSNDFTTSGTVTCQDLVVDTNTLNVDSTNDYVGINCTPSSALTVQGKRDNSPNISGIHMGSNSAGYDYGIEIANPSGENGLIDFTTNNGTDWEVRLIHIYNSSVFQIATQNKKIQIDSGTSNIELNGNTIVESDKTFNANLNSTRGQIITFQGEKSGVLSEGSFEYCCGAGSTSTGNYGMICAPCGIKLKGYTYQCAAGTFQDDPVSHTKVIQQLWVDNVAVACYIYADFSDTTLGSTGRRRYNGKFSSDEHSQVDTEYTIDNTYGSQATFKTVSLVNYDNSNASGNRLFVFAETLDDL